MANFPDMRPRGLRPAQAGLLALRPPIPVAALFSLLAAFGAVFSLSILHGDSKASSPIPSFLAEALGTPQSSAPLVRKPGLGTTLRVHNGAEVRIDDHQLTIRSADAGNARWRRFDNGASRRTAFGQEVVTFGRFHVEESLVVEKRQGERTWSWLLDSTLAPKLRAGGLVELVPRSGYPVDIRILPVEIFDAQGRDVTPDDAHWSLARQDGRWNLRLRLDDTKLPLPYVIDPIALVGTCPGPFPGGYQGCDVRTRTGAGTSITLTRPTNVVSGNVMVAQIAMRNVDATVTAPAGWTLAGNKRAETTIQQATYYRVADGTDTAGKTYMWSWTTGNVDAAGGILAYSGVDTTDPLDVTPTDNSGSGVSTATATGVTTRQDDDMIVAFYTARRNVTLTQNGGQSVAQRYTAISANGTNNNRIRITASDGTLAVPGATGNKTATISANQEWVAHLVTLEPPLAANGSGTMTANVANVANGSTGNMVTFTYTLAAGGMKNGSVTVDVPAGWSAPSTSSAAAGYSTVASCTGCTLSVAGQTITVDGITKDGGSTFTITYGAAPGPGATATTTGGSVTWAVSQKSRTSGTLTSLPAGSRPSINVYAADGSGTLAPSVTEVANGATGQSLVFTYTAAAGGISSGSVTLDVPTGWTAPNTSSGTAGYTTANAGSVSVAGRTITVSGLTLGGGSTFAITYGSGAGGQVTASTTGGSVTWAASSKATAGGTLASLAAGNRPTINVLSANGSGTLTADVSNVANGSTGNRITFTYTAATGGMNAGAVTIDVPTGWSAPSTSSSAAGYVTSSAGSVSVAASKITVSGVTLAGAATLTVTYGANPGPGATATSSGGSQTWPGQQKSTSGGSLQDVGSSPSINVYAADGSGTLTVSPGSVLAGQSGRTLSFTYTAATGGMSNGAVEITIPAGWSAPSTTSSAAGYTTSNLGSVSVAGQVITVSSLTRASGQTVTITYGDTSSGGPGATASQTRGANSFNGKQKSTSGGTLTALASSPSVTVNDSADGTGTLTVSPGSVLAGQSGRTLTFTYTAATGGMTNGAIELTIPAGWSAPSTTGSAAGYTTASTGSVSVAGQIATISSLSLNGGQTLTVTYGDTSSGGPGATAPSATGSQTWQARQKSVSAGTLTGLASSPSVNVNDSADGSGTLTVSPGSVLAGQTGRTLTFTYTADEGGMSSGAVEITLPAGWSAPSTTSSAAGYTTSSLGSVSAAGQVITVSGLTRASGQTVTVTYGDTSGSGPGATASQTRGANSFNGKQKSTSGGTLTALAASPSVSVNDSADGSGTLAGDTSNVFAGSTGRTIVFTYTAAAGGMTSGAIELTIPAGWSAPSTTSSAAGYTNSSAGTVSAAGQVATISGVSLNGGQTLTVTYGDTSGSGPGATAPATVGAQTWQAKQRSTAGGTLTSLGSSPNVTIFDNTNPSGSVTSPTDGSDVRAAVTVTAGASDTGSGVASVRFDVAPQSGSFSALDTDSNGGDGWSASWNTSGGGYPDGQYDLRVVTTDGAGNSSTSAVVGVTVDNTPPDTTIDSQPPDPSNDATPNFAFSANESGSAFECKLDGGSFAACTTPHTLPTLGEGSHTFQMRAIDAAGNTDGSPASYTWTVDLTQPAVSVDSPASGANVSGNVTVAGTASDASGVTSVEFESRPTSGSWTTISTDTSSPYSASWSTGSLGDGAYELRAIAVDAATNSRTSTVVTPVNVDNNAPTVTITAPGQYLNASAPSPFTATATSPDSDIQQIDFYECSNASANCSSGLWSSIGTDNDGAPYSAVWTPPAFDGNRALRAVATDNASNVGPPHVINVLVDRTAPADGSVSYAPTGGYRSGSITITTDDGGDSGSGLDLASRVIERHEATLTDDSCGAFPGTTTTLSSPDATTSSGHCYEYVFKIADQAGNIASYGPAGSFKVDTAAPTGSLTAPADGANVRGTIALSSDSADTGGSGVASAQFQRKLPADAGWTDVGAADTSSPYGVSLDTTGIADGQWQLRVVTTDRAGGSVASGARTVTVDNTAPTGSITTPADGARVRGTVAVASNAADAGTGVASAQFQRSVDGTTWLNVGLADTTSPYGADLDTTALVDGDYYVRVEIRDNVDNVHTSAATAVQIKVDNTPPAVTWLSPTDGAAVQGSVALNTTTTDADPSPSVGYEYRLRPAGPWTATPSPWNTNAIADGHYDLRATATDWAGNQNSATVSDVIADNLAPTVAITAPSVYVNASASSPMTFSANAADSTSGVDEVEFFECSNTSAGCSTGAFSSLGVDATAPYTASWTIPADGNRTLKVVARDNAGHEAETTRNATIDRALPDTTIIAKPGDPSKDAAPDFTFTASDPAPSSGALTFECKLDGGSYAACTSPHEVTLTTDGSHTFSVRSIDPAGNVDASAATWTWNLDTLAPAGTLDDPGRNLRGTKSVTSSVGDPPRDGYQSGLSSVAFEYSLDGSTWASIGINTSAPFDSEDWDTTGVSDAVYRLRIVATDAAGNITTSAVVTDVRVDNTPPTTSQDDPGAYLRATKPLSGAASDAGSGVDHVDFQYSPTGAGSWTTVGSDSSAPYGTSFDTTTAPDGHYDFRTVAYDVAGNSAAATPVADRLVDNTLPTATMSDPGANLRATVALTSTTGDPGGANASGVASVSYEYASQTDGVWQPTAPSWDTTSLADGLYDLRVTVVDNAGNTAVSAAVTGRRVDNTKPATTDNAPAGYQNGAVTVTLSPSDSGSGVQLTQYKLDSAPTFTVGTSVVVPADDGSHTIQYFSVDNAGNVEDVRTATVLIDTTPPVCPTCTAGDYLRGTVTLTAAPSDGGAGVQSVEFQHSPDGSVWTSIGAPDATAPYSVDWNTTSVSDGAYRLRARILDNADNPSFVDLHPGGTGVVVVDNTAPTASVGSPGEGALVSGTTTIAAVASDANPISYRYTVNGSTIASGSAPSVSWNTTSVADGPAQLQVVVTDAAGNETSSVVRNVSVDNLAPTPTLGDPGAAAGGTITLSATSDGDTSQVQFQRAQAGSGSWTTIGSDATAPFAAAFDTTAVADGLYDLRAVATDQSGQTGASGVRTLRVDNTQPNGSLQKPQAGSTVGGPSVRLDATANDPGGSGVAMVAFEYRPTGGGAWTPAGTATSQPFKVDWDATAVATGDYDFHAKVTDSAGNVFTTAFVTAHVDSTAPTVVLEDPGPSISGTVLLDATVSGPSASQVAFAYSPAGGNSWTTIVTDTSSPWSASFDTRTAADGLYDLRAVAFDALGNSSTSVRSGIRIDNTKPAITSTVPVDGSTVASASSIVLEVSEAVTLQGVTLDGAPTVPPIVTGTHIEFPTGALAQDPHTLAGELVDAAGKTVPFRIHFTVWSGSGETPYVEKNTSRLAGTTVEAPNGLGTATSPAGAWPANGDDWMVLRIDPAAAPAQLGPGLPAGSAIYDVTARWALAGSEIHTFQQPLEITIPAVGAGYVPVTFEDGAWRAIRHWSGGVPAEWSDSFEYTGGGIRIRTLHLTQFALVRDVTAPAQPSGFRGSATGGVLSLSWTLGADDSGVVSAVMLLIDGAVAQTLSGDSTSTTVSPFEAGDPRTFTLREVDPAGNQSAPSVALKAVPPLAGKTVTQAAADLGAAGFAVGDLTEGALGSGEPGTVLEPAGLSLAPVGSAVDLVVAPGVRFATRFAFSVATPPSFSWKKRRAVGARIKVSRPASVVATLVGPKGERLFAWRLQARSAGASIASLPMPTQIRRPGAYKLNWVARSGADVIRRTARLRLLSSGERLGRVVRPARSSVEVVLAGEAIDKDVALGSEERRVRIVQATEDRMFELAALGTVKVAVVDADQYGIQMIRDLRMVFPDLRIVALASRQSTLDAARRAGADRALPSTTPVAVLRRVVARLTR